MKLQRNDVEEVKNIGHIGHIGQSEIMTVGMETYHPNQIQPEHVDINSITEQESKKESYFNELLKISEIILKEVREVVRPRTAVKVRFLCGRENNEKAFVAVAGNQIIEKFILQFTLYRKKGREMMQRTIYIDSRESFALRNDIKMLMLFTVGDCLTLYAATFSDKQKFFRVGIDCSDVALSYECVRKGLYDVESKETYVGFAAKSLWYDKYLNYEMDTYIPDHDHFTGVMETMKSFLCREV